MAGMNVQLADRVQRSFSRSFGTYDGTADQQAWVAEKLVLELGGNGAPNRFASAFELGCGTGHLTRMLQRNFSFGALCLNDIAPQAFETAQAAGSSFVVGDARYVEWPTGIALVTSASMIQWMEDPAELMVKAARSLAPGGWLAISGFGPEQYRELTRIGTSARAPGLCRPADLAVAVEQHLEVVSVGEAVRTSYFGTPRKVLEHLRHTGVNGRAQKTWTKSTLTQFVDTYSRNFQTPEGVSLTYHPVWIIARKPA